MNLRSLLHRKTTMVPLLPYTEDRDDAHPINSVRSFQLGPPGTDEERLERLLTPAERDIIEHHLI